MYVAAPGPEKAAYTVCPGSLDPFCIGKYSLILDL